MPFSTKEFRYYFSIQRDDLASYGRYLSDQSILVSFVHLRKSVDRKRSFLEILKKHRGPVMLDSGAFTNFTKPGTVKYDEWLEFAKEAKSWATELIQFDDLRSRARTLKYYNAAKSAGVDTLFVDHLWWKTHMEEVRGIWKSSDKLALGGFGKTFAGQEDTPRAGIKTLDTVFEISREENTVVHLLAAGSMKRFLHVLDRVHSIDSSGWRKAAAYRQFIAYERADVGPFRVPIMRVYTGPGANRTDKPIPRELKESLWDKPLSRLASTDVRHDQKCRIASIYHLKRYIKALNLWKPDQFRKWKDSDDAKPTKKSYVFFDDLDFGDFEKADDIDEAFAEYHDAVNMTHAELKAWADTECSHLASEDRSPVERNLRLLSKPKDEWNARDAADARKTVAFIARHLAQRDGPGEPADEGCPSKRDIALMNWAHDPRKESKLEKSIGQDRLAILKTKEERFVLGVVLEPNDGDDGAPFDPDTQRDIYSDEEIRQSCHKFMEDFRNVGLMHRTLVNGKVAILESYISPIDFWVTLDGETFSAKPKDAKAEHVRKGTWLLGLRVKDNAMWQKVKDGEIDGLSIGGSARRVPADGKPAGDQL